ncbi:MAG TPA: rRNA maturation RNase YbeY [Candidatus Paceibacterota bacterium]
MTESESEKFSIINETRTSPAFFKKKAGLVSRIKDAVLGKNYALSIVIISAEKSKKLNRDYRDKNKPTDILSFPLSKKEGEIFLCLKQAETEAEKFGREYENFLLFLLIHGFCHLKGMTHSSKMESIERKFRNRFGV